MVAQTTDRLDANVGLDPCQLFPQEAYIDLHVILYSIGLIAPDSGQKDLLGQDPALCLEQETHNIELSCGEADGFVTADQHTRCQVQTRIAEGQLIDLVPLTSQEGVDACQQLTGVKGLGEIIVSCSTRSITSTTALLPSLLPR